MTNEDTSQNGICKNSFLKVQDITQQVNSHRGQSGSKLRLQAAKLFNTPDNREVLVLDFYPVFKDLAWVWQSGAVGAIELSHLDRKQLQNAKHPFLLYLKAHFVGHSLTELVLSGESLQFNFTDGRHFVWNFGTKEWSFSVPERKDYSQRLPNWAAVDKLISVAPTAASAAVIEGEVAITKADPKFAKLQANVEKDLAESTAWLSANRPSIEFFFQNPQLWGAPLSEIPPEHQIWLESIANKVSFGGSRKLALENLKKLLSRYQRKEQKAQERLRTLLPKVPVAVPLFKKDKQALEKAGPKKVELGEGVEAIVGRRAEENDELFRRAASRDIWLHVRGQRGAHVWIKRGQKGFGAKGEISDSLLKKAAQLAAQYSKASGGWISVDYTERRYLKKLKGMDAGALQVLQSKTIFVSLDEG